MVAKCLRSLVGCHWGYSFNSRWWIVILLYPFVRSLFSSGVLARVLRTDPDTAAPAARGLLRGSIFFFILSLSFFSPPFLLSFSIRNNRRTIDPVLIARVHCTVIYKMSANNQPDPPKKGDDPKRTVQLCEASGTRAYFSNVTLLLFFFSLENYACPTKVFFLNLIFVSERGFFFFFWSFRDCLQINQYWIFYWDSFAI